MRWPIQLQLLVPILAVVVLAIVATSVASAYLGGIRARQEQEDNLRRVVATMAEANFPITDEVLRMIRGLSGAELVYLDPKGRCEAATLSLDHDELDQLQRLRQDQTAEPVVTLRRGAYVGDRVAIQRPGGMPSAGSVVVLYPKMPRWAILRQAVSYPTLMAAAIAAAAAILVTTGLARRFVRPIHRLHEQAGAMVRGEFRPVAVSPRNDEIRDLALTINVMADQLSRYEREIRQSERLRTLGQLGAGIAHQLRNAATGGRMAIELHQRSCPAGEQDESLEVAMRQLRLMESYLQRFLALGRPSVEPQEIVALDRVVEDALALVRPACVHAGIDLRVVAAPGLLQVRGYPESLHQLVVNLVLNAVEAAVSQAGGPPQVIVELENQPGRAVLRIKDSGPGPSPQVQATLFEPFVTDKPDGTGLGLFVTRQIAQAHGATVHWERAGEMTCFSVDFPLPAGETS